MKFSMIPSLELKVQRQLSFLSKERRRPIIWKNFIKTAVVLSWVLTNLIPFDALLLMKTFEPYAVAVQCDGNFNIA